MNMKYTIERIKIKIRFLIIIGYIKHDGEDIMSRETVASFTQIRNRLIIYYYTYIISHEIHIPYREN